MINSALVVDDIEADRYIARWTLNRSKMVAKVFEARDGKEAIELLHAFDVQKEEH